MSESEQTSASDGSPSVGVSDVEDTETSTVTLEVEVACPRATDQQLQMYEEMADLFATRFETFVSKNLDYDSSFLTAGEVDAVYGGGPFEDAQHANLYKLFTRIQDKDQRFYSLVFGNGENLVGEKPAETAGDAGVYWFMVEWLLRYNE